MPGSGVDFNGLFGVNTPPRPDTVNPLTQRFKYDFAIAFVVEGFVEGTNIDAGRHAIERIDPAVYLNSSYYERWLLGAQSTIVEAGVCSLEEIEARIDSLRAETGDG